MSENDAPIDPLLHNMEPELDSAGDDEAGDDAADEADLDDGAA